MSTKLAQNDSSVTEIRIRAKGLVEEAAASVENSETLDELHEQLEELRRNLYKARPMVAAAIDLRDDFLWRTRKEQ